MGGRAHGRGLPTVVDEDPAEWMAHAACQDKPTSFWFPVDGAGTQRAKWACEPCPVQAECLDYALENRIDHGVWGGESERSRRRLLREVKGLTHLSPDQGVAAPDEVG